MSDLAKTIIEPQMAVEPETVIEPEKVIEIEGLVNRFGHFLVHDQLNLTLERGQILGVVGGSGSGKSVLMNTILGIQKQQAGKIILLGEDQKR